MPAVVSIDGQLVDPADAKISVFDRGFLYGDSVYEVLRTYAGEPFELGPHLERLRGSATRIGMALPFSDELLAAEVRAAHAKSGHADSYVRLVVTRGSGPIGLDARLASAPRRVVIALDVEPMRPPPAAYADGVEVALVGVRRNLKEAIDPQAKTGNYLNSVLAVSEAKAKGAYEAVMLDHRGLVTEGSSSNVFIVVGGVVLTPPIDAGILAGVTRAVVLRLLAGLGRRALELPLTPEALSAADEVFITSSIREIVPVVRVDGRAVGEGRPGPVVRELQAAFAAYVRAGITAGGR